MAKYVLKRVLMALFTIFLVATLTFFLRKAVPGNPFVSEKTPPQSVLDALNEKYGLDQPLSVQYFKYMGNLLRGDLGVSVKMQKNYPVISIIKDITDETRREQELDKERRRTAELADRVIEKQMRVAQEIASLLGETTAETKIALTRLKDTIEPGGEVKR